MSTPYLFSDTKKRSFWSKKISSYKKNKIGLVVSGSSKHQNDINRSIPLNKFEMILDLPFDFFLLQKELSVNEKRLIKNFSNLYNFFDEIFHSNLLIKFNLGRPETLSINLVLKLNNINKI